MRLTISQENAFKPLINHLNIFILRGLKPSKNPVKTDYRFEIPNSFEKYLASKFKVNSKYAYFVSFFFQFSRPF